MKRETFDEDNSIGSPFLFDGEDKKEGLTIPEGPIYPIYSEHYAGITQNAFDPHHQALHLHHDQQHQYYDPHHSYQQYDQIPHYQQHEFAPPTGAHNPDFEEDKNLICPHQDCGKQFKKQNAYHSHLKTHTSTSKPYLCRVCSFSFSRSHDLKRHEYIHSKDKPFLCTGCNRGFSRRDALKRHLDSMKNRPGGCGATKKRD